MKLSSEEVENYIDLWLAIKPYINPKDKVEACEKFLNIINDAVCELEEVSDEWVGFDSTIDKVIRDNYIEHAELDEYDENDEW
jgi:hypothetical protein